MSHDATTHHEGAVKIYSLVFLGLLVLTALTVLAAFHDFGSFNTVIALIIAIVKATLVILFFMHLKGKDTGLLKLYVVGAFVFVVIMIGMTMNDIATRNWGPKVEAGSWIKRSPHQYFDTAEPATTEHHT